MAQIFSRKRSRIVTSPPPRPAVVLRKEPLNTEPTSPAGSRNVQEAFLKEVGLFASEIDLNVQDVLPQEEAELLSVAMNHKSMEFPGIILSDPYFTEEQWKLVVSQKHSLLDEAGDLMKILRNQDEWKEKKEEIESHLDCWEKQHTSVPLCLCIAHKVRDPKMFRMIQELVCISPPLNDYKGKRVGTLLFTHLFDLAGMNNISLEEVQQGSMSKVKYFLRLPSGTQCLYSGYPDFNFFQTFTCEERESFVKMSKTERVCGVGEVQSHKGTSDLSKACAYAQAGIYAIGNLHTTQSTSNLTTVILYKDLTAHVALASIDRTKANEEIMGEASYKLIRPCSWKLNEPEELADFAKVFISTMKYCLSDSTS